MGEASVSFGDSQNYNEESPNKQQQAGGNHNGTNNISNNNNINKPKKSRPNNKRSKQGMDDSDRTASNKRGSVPREPKYKCELCSFSTAYLYSINRHAIKVHKDIVTQEDGSIKACFEKLETKKEPVTLPSLFSSPSTSQSSTHPPQTAAQPVVATTAAAVPAPGQEFDGLQEFNNIVDSLGVSASTQWTDPSTATTDQLGPIKFATTDGTQINIFRTDYIPFGQTESHFITFEKADESSVTVGDTLLNGYLGNNLQPVHHHQQHHQPEPKFLHLSTSSSVGNSSQHSQQHEVKTENDATNGPGRTNNNSTSPKKPGKSKKRKSSLGTSDSGNDDMSSDGKGGPEKKKRKQNAPISLIKSTVSKCPLCNFSSKYPSNTGRHFQSVHKAECKELLEGRLTLEGIVKKEERVEKTQSPPKKKKPPSKKPVELKIPQVGAPSSQDYSDASGMSSQHAGPSAADELQQFVQNEHLEMFAGPEIDNVEPIASFIDSLLSSCGGANEWGLHQMEGTYTVEAAHFTHNPAETVAQPHAVMQLEPQINGMGSNYIQQYNQVHQVQIQAQPLQQYQQHPTPVTETHTTPGYHPVPQMQQIQSQTQTAQVAQTPKKPAKNNKPNAQTTLTPEEQKQAALNRRREKRREQRLKKQAEKNAQQQQQQQQPPPQQQAQQHQQNATPQKQVPPSSVGISIDNPTPVTTAAPVGVDNSLRNEVRAAVEGTYETLVSSSHSLTTNQYQGSYGTAVDTPMSTPTETPVNSSVTTTTLQPAMNVQMNYQMQSGMHNLMETVQVASVGTAVDTPVVTPAGTPLPVATLEWSSPLYHPAPNQAVPVTDGSTAYTTLNVAAMNIGDVHTYLPIDFNDLSHTTTTLQPLDPTIVITNSATSPNAPVLSIPQPMVPLNVEDNSFFDNTLRPSEIQTTTVANSQQVFSTDNQQVEAKKSDPNAAKPLSPRIRSVEDMEAAKQDRLAKRREKYRQQQEMKKKGGVQSPGTPEVKKKQVPPEVLEARRKRELERRKEKRKQLAEQKRLLQQQQQQQSASDSGGGGGQLPASNSVPKTPVGVVSSEVVGVKEVVVVPSVTTTTNSVPSTNSSSENKPVSSDSSGPGIVTTPADAPKVVCGGEPGALSASGEMKDADSVGSISGVVVHQGEDPVIGSTSTTTTTTSVKVEPNTTTTSLQSQADQVQETRRDNPQEYFRRSEESSNMINNDHHQHHQVTTTAANDIGFTTSDLKPAAGIEGSTLTSLHVMEGMGLEKVSGQCEPTPFMFTSSEDSALYKTSASTFMGQQQVPSTGNTFDFINYPSELPAQSALSEVPQHPWESEFRDLNATFTSDVSASTVAAVNAELITTDNNPGVEGIVTGKAEEPLLPPSATGVSATPSSDLAQVPVDVKIPAIESVPGSSGSMPLKTKSRGQLTPEEIEAKKMKRREKQKEYNKNRKSRQMAVGKDGESTAGGTGTHVGNESIIDPVAVAGEMKEKKRKKSLEQGRQSQKRRKSGEKKPVVENASGDDKGKTDSTETKGGEKTIKFIKVDHSPKVQNCPDCDFTTDTNYKLMVHKTVHDALNKMPPFVKSMIEATGKVDYLLKHQPDPFEGKVKPEEEVAGIGTEVQNDPV